MAGTNTVTTADLGKGVTHYTMDWLSDASGDVNTNTFDIAMGYIIAIKFTPDGGGTAPTALYDVTLDDSDAYDLAGALGANLSATVPSRSVPLVNTYGALFFEGGTCDLVVTNAGNAKGGIVELWVQG